MAEAAPAIALDAEMAARLIASRFPELAGKDIRPLAAKGTDNQIFRIGDDLCARFPKVAWAAATAQREAGALPRFRGAPLAVPEVYGLGAPGGGYPYDWSVLSWLPGAPLEDGAMVDPGVQVRQLSEFFGLLRSIPPDPAFRFGRENNGRGAPLATRSAPFEAALKRLPGLNGDFANRLWSGALRAGEPSPPVWLHGDVHPGNVLAADGQISGIIDWGLCGVGDGACDLLTAWAIFDRVPREAYRRAVNASEAEWLRGAGWALSMAVIYLPYAYENGLRSDMSERMIARLMEDFA